MRFFSLEMALHMRPRKREISKGAMGTRTSFQTLWGVPRGQDSVNSSISSYSTSARFAFQTNLYCHHEEVWLRINGFKYGK